MKRTKKNKTLLITIIVAISALIICAIIYGFTQINQQSDSSPDDIDEEFVSEEDLSAPSSPDSIDFIEISYNNYSDSIAISGEDYVEYYISENLEDEEDTEEDDEEPDTKFVDTSEIMQYIFDNVISHLNNTAPEDETWSITIYSTDGISYTGGEGEEPEWLTKLIDKVKTIAEF